MTFRPSDDVLDEVSTSQPIVPTNENDSFSQTEWWHMFQQPNDLDNQPAFLNQETSSAVPDIKWEEVKAPDLSELLKEKWEVIDNDIENMTQEKEDELNSSMSPNQSDLTQQNSSVSEEKKQNIIAAESNIDWEKNQIENKISENEVQNENISLSTIDGKLSDEERSQIISWMEWSINSNLDLLVDKNWELIVMKYKKIHRLFFRWGVFFVATLLGIIGWTIFQVKAGSSYNVEMINDEMINNKSAWRETTSYQVFQELSEDWVEIDTLVPYGSALWNNKSFQTKSNLISYKWVILPQLAFINVNEKFISLPDFNSQELTRDDIKSLINVLIINNNIYRKTTNLPNVEDLRWNGVVFEWNMIDGFNLKCLDNKKTSDFVCDKFLDNFFKYGKYYDLSKYATELSKLTKDIRKYGKNTEPICEMIKEYTLRAWAVSDVLLSIMENCWEDDYKYYKKLINFIDLENSLRQPDLSDKVFDDPDLNAYKLLSAQQSVYKILDWTSINENYIKSYLSFVQALLNKDNWNNRYLAPIYKDIIYVFNTDELYQKLMQKWKLSSDIKLQIDQINNWNSLYGYISLMSQLTTPNLIKNDSEYTGMEVEQKTIDDIFAQYYAMTDRLTIRKVTKISDDEIRVQTEMFTDKITSATNWETLKITVVLRKQDNLLYVDSIKVANQQKFTDILSIYANEWNVTFYAMMWYIEEQVGMWYEKVSKDTDNQPTFCEQIQERSDISLYTCDSSHISLYKWDIEYNFDLENWILKSFTISDESLESEIKKKLEWVMFMKDETPTIITSIIDFSIETQDDSIEKKLDILNQFRIHFKLIPDDIHVIEWESNEFLVDFTLWDFKLQGRYNTETHLLSKIMYTDCSENVEIRNLTISITTENDSQLIEILNNPRIFLTQANPAAYKKYQKVCWWTKNKN